MSCKECGRSLQVHHLSGFRAYCDPRGSLDRRQGSFTAKQVNNMNRILGNKITTAALDQERREK